MENQRHQQIEMFLQQHTPLSQCDMSTSKNVLYLSSVKSKIIKGNQTMLTIEFSDSTGAISMTIWNASAAEVNLYESAANNVVFLTNIQYKSVNEIKACTLTNLKDIFEVVPAELIQADEYFDIYESLNVIDTAIASISDKELKAIVAAIFSKEINGLSIRQHLLTAKAAMSNHHSFAGGLAYHTASMVTTGSLIIDNQYPNMNKDLFVAGALLHDLGKIAELGTTSYTVEGNLIAHISLVDGYIVEAATLQQKLESKKILALRHLILSHHGQKDWGSPVIPALPEAMLLHHVDNLDAKTAAMRFESTKLNTTNSIMSTAPLYGVNGVYPTSTEMLLNE